MATVPQLKKYMKMYAVYWEKGDPGPSGQQQWKAPVEIRCRWTDRQEEMPATPGGGDMWTSRSYVLCDRELKVNGVLWQGRYSELISTTDPFANPDSAEIMRFDVTPANKKGDKFLYKAFL